MDKVALIVAGGRGTRMKAGIPKQFLLLNQKPVLMRTLEAFYRFDTHIRIIVVLPENQLKTWNSLCHEYNFKIKHETGTGGETRFHSVKKNLSDIPDDSLVAVHDGVRPLVSNSTISRCFSAAAEWGNAIPCVEIPETIRQLDSSGTLPADRSKYRLIQTPQVFRGKILKEAYRQEYNTAFTDDAGVVENAGQKIMLVEGNPENIKITLMKDLVAASALLEFVNS